MMRIAVDSSLMVITKKMCDIHIPLLLFYVHCASQTLKLLSGKHSFTYRVDIIPSSIHR